MNPFDENRKLDPKRLIRVMDDYRTHRTAIAAQRQAQEEAAKKNDALRVHGGGGSGPAAGSDTWKDPLDMSNDEFAAMERRVIQHAVRGG